MNNLIKITARIGRNSRKLNKNIKNTFRVQQNAFKMLSANVPSFKFSSSPSEFTF